MPVAVIILPWPSFQSLVYGNMFPIFVLYCCDGVRLFLCWTGLLTCPLFIAQMILEWMWSGGGMILTGTNQTTPRKTCPNTTLSTPNCTWTDLDPNMSLPGEKPFTNHMSYGTVIWPPMWRWSRHEDVKDLEKRAFLLTSHHKWSTDLCQREKLFHISVLSLLTQMLNEYKQIFSDCLLTHASYITYSLSSLYNSQWYAAW